MVLLRQEGIAVSASMVGRILGRAKARGYLREPIYTSYPARKRRRQRPYATRKPSDYRIELSGDLVQVDTLDPRPLPGALLKHFTAPDTVSRWDVMQVRGAATARTATAFLDTISARIPFTVKAIRVDGGSEFKTECEPARRDRGIRLFVLPPRSPQAQPSRGARPTHPPGGILCNHQRRDHGRRHEHRPQGLGECLQPPPPPPTPRLPDPSRVRQHNHTTNINRKEPTVSHLPNECTRLTPRSGNV